MARVRAGGGFQRKGCGLIGRGPSKYRAVRTVVDGHKFASKREARRYEQLKILRAQGKIYGLELQPRYPVHVGKKLVCTYVADFRYFDVERGREVVEDVKGVKTPVYRLKKKLVSAVYHIDIEEV